MPTFEPYNLITLYPIRVYNARKGDFDCMSVHDIILQCNTDALTEYSI